MIEHKVNGKLHREDGPAAEWKDGTKEWYLNGKRHRIGEPAVEWFDGGKLWYVNGQLHRLDGPAIKRAHSAKFLRDMQEFHISGILCSVSIPSGKDAQCCWNSQNYKQLLLLTQYARTIK